MQMDTRRPPNNGDAGSRALSTLTLLRPHNLCLVHVCSELSGDALSLYGFKPCWKPNCSGIFPPFTQFKPILFNSEWIPFSFFHLTVLHSAAFKLMIVFIAYYYCASRWEKCISLKTEQGNGRKLQIAWDKSSVGAVLALGQVRTPIPNSYPSDHTLSSLLSPSQTNPSSPLGFVVVVVVAPLWIPSHLQARCQRATRYKKGTCSSGSPLVQNIHTNSNPSRPHSPLLVLKCW